ncbi:hypothetical protein F5887DRAFT_115510 [Amanita rubescens]|nr:hypothetical protein F5887DRAFT_115510 [Amanita rubescens]
MKLAQSLALLISASFTIPSTLADFHVVQVVPNRSIASLQACPSNYYNCKCLLDGDRAAQVVVNFQGVGLLPDNFFSTIAGLCGMGQLNFYKQGDGHWDFYVDGGDGSLQGTCYPNSADSSCFGTAVHDQLVCYSYICGN